MSPCLFNFYAEYIMRNASLDEVQAAIKMTGRNINNLRYGDNTTLLAESEEELKSLLMKVKESEKVGLKLSILKSKIMISIPITSWQIDGETLELVTDFIFLGFKITADGYWRLKIKRRFLLGRKAMANLHSILKSGDITLSRNACIVNHLLGFFILMVFPVVMYGCESWIIKNAVCQKTDTFKL